MPISQGGKVVYNIQMLPISNSMYPEYTYNDLLHITTPSNFTIGNTYCCRNNGRFYLPWNVYICHKLIGIDKAVLTFKGRNNSFIDEPIEKKYCAWEIIGKV